MSKSYAGDFDGYDSSGSILCEAVITLMFSDRLLRAKCYDTALYVKIVVSGRNYRSCQR